MKTAGALTLIAALFLAGASFAAAGNPDGKIHLSYWEKWTGPEELAMREVVDAFNRSQDRIVVDYLSVGQVEQKTLLAIAGGDPPDIAGLYLLDVCSFADRDALTPLSSFIRTGGTTTDAYLSRYARAYGEMGVYRGEVWALPSTPTTTALFWNKDLFRAAGLNPDQPPRTIDELVSMSEKLTVHDAAGDLTQVGFLPQTNASWIWAFPQWFGGQIFDGKDVTIGHDPTNVKAYDWLRGFTERYGLENVSRLSASFGTLSTPDDPFSSGKVAILLDGVWRYDYMQQFAPGIEYGVAPWPVAAPGVNDFSVAEADMLVIPRGAKHAKEAWEFLNYVSSPNLAAQSVNELSGLELLCFVQKKPSPLVQWSPYFTEHHPDPNIAIFRKLADSPHTISAPQIGIGDEYVGSLYLAFDRVRLGLATPQEAVNECQERMEQSWKWHQQSLALRHPNMAAAAPPAANASKAAPQ